MDRSWMTRPRITEEYENGVEDFLQFAAENAADFRGVYFCPCVKCLNGRRQSLDDIRTHLICDGICPTYTRWIWHGELSEMSSTPANVGVHEEVGDRIEDMLRDLGQEGFRQTHAPYFEKLDNDSKKPLYVGCTKYTRLSGVLALVNLKARFGWSDKSFNELLLLLKNMLPEDNTLPKNHYEAKKILCPVGMEYQKIHACPNDCILYRHEYAELRNCPTCGVSRYKVNSNDCGEDATTYKDRPSKVCWYLPVIPRFKRLFANAEDAKNLTWHADGRIKDGLLRHPADSPQWKTIDQLYPEFSQDPRNLRVALASDGMNPFGNLSCNHSSWPVLLMIYNLPPWLCIKRKYIMMSMMIAGPRQPGNDIDVYLAPLIEDLKKLWVEGVDVYDGNAHETFKLRALIFCTINDFPAYGNLSGYSVKGHHACPICEKDTSYIQLKHGKKTVYTRHRRFLKPFHPYRRMKKAFNGTSEIDSAPIPLSGVEVLDRVNNITIIYGKTQKKDGSANKIWKKRSIFFDLPYWCDLNVRHCLDVMHVEKNVCDSLVGTLLNIKGKTKDGLKCRQDLAEMGIRQQLHPVSKGLRTYLPPACHTMSTSEKKSFCHCLKNVKVPQGYSSNIKSLVSVTEMKLVGLKSHDCHVLMQQLLPVAIRGILPDKVRVAITRLCFFFNAICSKVIDPKQLDDLENEASIIVCQLEMYFPPAFFDIMVHLVVHLVREIRLCGPVYLRWMYPVERYMKVLKSYTKNQYRPEASIVERYVAEEAIEFCSDYIENASPVGLPQSRHESSHQGRGKRGFNVVTMDRQQLSQAHLYVLNNTAEVIPYIDAHKEYVTACHPTMNMMRVLQEHNKSFVNWFRKTIFASDNASKTLSLLAVGPNLNVLTWRGYDINNYSFYTKSQDDNSTVQNCGVTIDAHSEHFSSALDNHPIRASMPYYGLIKEIWELDYGEFRVPVFKCQWVNGNAGVRQDKMGFTLVDLQKIGYKDEPFILAAQARQVFYVEDPSDARWSVVLQGKTTGIPPDIDVSTLDVNDIPTFCTEMPSVNAENEEDDVFANRIDHDEGLWENIAT
ncbi:uncharacterized protein [Glycine max]|uniref:uncharacterized protein n=1 Tax=Glycine max TaxID=3847 RepID=UPI000233E1BD|nr:uncharacterized protein LOC100787031 [Glycine max]|eukprot:XP_003554943.1 uncharacterized protein LOC100787031 [Glycine max]